ncbi:peroxidase, partial [filamentous cyanobacterium CCP5]
MDNPLIYNNPYQAGELETYTVTGSGNNLDNPDWGEAGHPLLNLAPLEYGDGYSTPAGSDRPNPRVISNALAQQDQLTPESRGLSNWIWAWGQFLDHDLSLTPDTRDRPITIPVAAGDPYLDPFGSGQVGISMGDTVFLTDTGTDPTNPRQLPNEVTSWLDGSMVYGSTPERIAGLRSFSNGKLKISDGAMLPLFDGSMAMDNPTGRPSGNLYMAGDARANENPILTAVHTVFVREHNRLATDLAVAHPDWNDEQLFQRARQINIAQIQSITYNEYLPALLGKGDLEQYKGYDSTVNPDISRTFSTAAFRLGHTQLSPAIPLLNPTGQMEGTPLSLSEGFFLGSKLLQQTGIDPILL